MCVSHFKVNIVGNGYVPWKLHCGPPEFQQPSLYAMSDPLKLKMGLKIVTVNNL